MLQKRELGGIVNAENRAAAAASKRGKGNLRGAALAGASFANIPGQNLAQAAGAGALVAGPKGAAVAGAVALAAAFGQYANQATKAAAETQKLNLALESVTGPQSAQALAAIRGIVDDFNQPLADATRGFTQLTAAAIANGNTVEEVENLYRGLSAATKATGGDSQDLAGVIRAATQVLSKGRVQAEELTGQIGDRLPGAFALFAEATNRSTAQLADALKKGEVTAQEFVTNFAKLLRDRYEPAAKRIADSPAEAGARLNTALNDLSIAVGRLLGPIGAAFQDTFTAIAKEITKAADALARFFGIGIENQIAKVEQKLLKAKETAERFDSSGTDAAAATKTESMPTTAWPCWRKSFSC